MRAPGNEEASALAGAEASGETHENIAIVSPPAPQGKPPDAEVDRERRLYELAGRANAAAAEMVAAVADGVFWAVECGRALIEAKAQLGHGRWLPWAQANLSFGVRQAQKCMRLAERFGELANTTCDSYLPSIDSALAAISAGRDLNEFPILGNSTEPPARAFDGVCKMDEKAQRQVVDAIDAALRMVASAQRQLDTRHVPGLATVGSAIDELVGAAQALLAIVPLYPAGGGADEKWRLLKLTTDQLRTERAGLVMPRNGCTLGDQIFEMRPGLAQDGLAAAMREMAGWQPGRRDRHRETFATPTAYDSRGTWAGNNYHGLGWCARHRRDPGMSDLRHEQALRADYEAAKDVPGTSLPEADAAAGEAMS